MKKQSDTSQYQLSIRAPRPYFAELPYYAWGQVNYDSEGNCKDPRDRDWTWMELTHRDTNEQVQISSQDGLWTISGGEPAASRIAHFLKVRCNGEWLAGSPKPDLRDWDHELAAGRAALVAVNFQNDLLAPFAAGHIFWGSWKWIGWFGTTFTWVGRWIMDAVVRSDPRAVNLCIDWLREGTYNDSQSAALRYALQRFTGLSYQTDSEWVHWYDSAGKTQFPEPDMDVWYEDLKKIHGP